LLDSLLQEAVYHKIIETLFSPAEVDCVSRLCCLPAQQHHTTTTALHTATSVGYTVGHKHRGVEFWRLACMLGIQAS